MNYLRYLITLPYSALLHATFRFLSVTFFAGVFFFCSPSLFYFTFFFLLSTVFFSFRFFFAILVNLFFPDVNSFCFGRRKMLKKFDKWTGGSRGREYFTSLVQTQHWINGSRAHGVRKEGEK